MTKKQTTDKINKPEFAPEEWRKAAIMYDTSFAWCKNQISAWGKNQISFTPGFNEMFDEALDGVVPCKCSRKIPKNLLN